MKMIYVFGNGNISWENFHQLYLEPLQNFNLAECEFLMGDFNGVDTLMMEFLKDKTSHVSLLHIGEKPRYSVNTFNTKAGSWKTIGGFKTDKERDHYAIAMCTHFLAADLNSDEIRTSGTFRNIEKCLTLGKVRI